MRERTTWNRDEISRVAAMPKKADPYLMNQDHVSQNPSAEKYMNGTPSSWAEDVHSPNEWEKEYSNGQTKRDEIGLAELRPETFSHPEKTASNQLLVKKADLTVKVARLMLGNKVAEEVVEDQAVALMALPDSDLIETFQRLAQEEQQGQGQGQEPPAQQQEQQAGMQQQSAAQQCMEAMQSGDPQKMQAAMQQMVQEAMKQQQGGQQQGGQQQGAPQFPVASAKKAQQDQGQGQAQQEPAQQQQQAAVVPPVAGQQDQQQQQAGMQQQALQQQIQALQEQIQQMQQQAGQQAPAQQQMDQQEPTLASDDMLLDEMLAPAGGGADMGGIGEIELEPASMDVGEIGLGPEDDVLKTLFANQETQDAQEAQQAQGQQGQGQQVQASVLRSPSSRTVGTRPTVGVSKVGGASAPQVRTASNDIDKLSNLWSSAPDVREHFGLK